MYQGKFSPRKSRRPNRKAPIVMLLSLLLCVTLTVGGTLAYLTSTTEGVQNTFTPGRVSCNVDEDFSGTQKTRIQVDNTSNIEAYIRVKLIAYRVDGEDNHRIGGEAQVPGFELNSDAWVPHNGFYYCKAPIPAGGQTPNLLKSGMQLNAFDDADGGRLVVEVMAEAIQSQPVQAVAESWAGPPQFKEVSI